MSHRVLVFALLVVSAIAALAVVTAFLWTEGDDPGPSLIIEAGNVDNLALASPVFWERGLFWLIRLEDDEIIAIYARDPNQGCTVPWRPTYTFENVKGWFRNPCHGQIYDIEGRCVFGQCIRGLDRFEVTVKNGDIFVDTGSQYPAPP